MIKNHDFIVTIDSDTVLDENALIRVVEPLKNPKVGASTGDVLLLNEKKNVLTRMIGAYYWIGLNVFKKAQSALGMVVCCSGCLAAYRSDVINEIIEEFVNQQFLGEPCTHSEDRHLTNLVLRNGYDVKYAPLAISYTETPSTITGFLKQQQRWKRGFIRESTFTLTYAWKRRPLLFFQILFCELTIPFMSFGLMIALFISIFTNPSIVLTTLLPSWIIFMFIRYIQVLFYGKKKIPGLLVYIVFLF
jgi:cellulose synthase/poly-beta-1,6-N-acetylglucosamine synthase-like glycosyltransferase